ncbi:MAG TPA: HAD family hydrolase [Stellaceae bacterium]|nr:HAD family hydrolase [Stellaceae bacterium]
MPDIPPPPIAAPIKGIDLIIFDCDGVLIDSEIIASRVEALELTAIGCSITADEIAVRFCGIPVRETLAAIEAEWGSRFPDGFVERLNERKKAAFRTELEAIAGIADALDAIAGPVCVASSSGPQHLEEHLGRVGLWDRFAPHVFSAAMVARGKPAPDVFLHAASQMGVDPARCLVIEDSIAGVQAGVAAGMTVIGFIGGGHSGPAMIDRLTGAGAVRVYDHHRALPALLAEFGSL